MSLDSLIDACKDGSLKFIFVGGKGGVGKSTSSSAIATLLATVCKKRILLVSTDPAHSLGDAFRTKFSNIPTSPMQNLDVMELNPKETMEKELEKWAEYANEFTNDSAESDLVNKIKGFQEWLSGIPGMDEATALNSALSYIESNQYDLIIFDTAPTGHTLKLLALPAILEVGIDKLQGWQSTLWGYWDAFKGLTSSASASQAKRRADIKKEVAQKLIDYKTGIQKVASMIQDQTKTRFVVVCIAEFLSVSETQRLLQELKKNDVRASHIIVNQLVVKDALSQDELTQLESLAEIGDLKMNTTLIRKTIHACRLTTARKAIQEKYLKVLKGLEETQEILDGICEVPLLPEEVTGNDALSRFSQLLVKSSTFKLPSDSSTTTKQIMPTLGNYVRIMGLEKAPHLNGLEGTVISDVDTETGRYGVTVVYQGKEKKIALQPKNLMILHSSSNTDEVVKTKKVKKNSQEAVRNVSTDEAKLNDNVMDKAYGLLQDPEIQQMIADNPRVQAAIDDVMQNPMNFMKYMSDPELSPFLMKAMSKLK